jgi:phosphoglycolate phosphatase-like HAD superfamily hydrolase
MTVPRVKSVRTEALIFDFDGVLVESVDVKTRAFAALYAEYGSSVVSQVVAYHLAHGGISRHEKFRYFHRTFLDRPLDPAEEKQLAERFAELVEDAVVKAPWVAGAVDILEHNVSTLPMFVASGTPEEELRRIVSRRNITHYFVSVHGAPATKGEIIERIVRYHGYARDRVLVVGDSTADHEGAVGTGVRFVGRVSSGSSPFPSDVPVIADLRVLPAFL